MYDVGRGVTTCVGEDTDDRSSNPSSTSLIGDDKYKKRSEYRNCIIGIASGFRILFSYILTEVHVYIIHTYIHERYVCILAINIAYNFNILWYILHIISISCGITYSLNKLSYVTRYTIATSCERHRDTRICLWAIIM